MNKEETPGKGLFFGSPLLVLQLSRNFRKKRYIIGVVLSIIDVDLTIIDVDLTIIGVDLSLYGTSTLFTPCLTTFWDGPLYISETLPFLQRISRCNAFSGVIRVDYWPIGCFMSSSNSETDFSSISSYL